jgi:hypothetical protein
MFGSGVIHLGMTLLASIILLGVSAGFEAGRRAGMAQDPTALISLDVDSAIPGVQSSGTEPVFAEQISIEVVIETPFETGAFEVDVLFDSATVEFAGWQQGPFLAGTGRATSCATLPHEHDIRIGCSSSGAAPPPGATGSGVLATLHMKPRLAGETCFVFLLVETATVAGEPLPTSARGACVWLGVDTDGDGCADYQESGPDWRLGGLRDSLNGWDVFDVPLPALTPSSVDGVRDHAVTLADMLAVLMYTGVREGGAANGNGLSYDSDLNQNAVFDGREYDRSPSTATGQVWRSGPPNGAVTLADVLTVLAQVGTRCI